MLFNSFTFVYFFLVTYALYRALPHRPQNLVLLAASYVFYGFWDGRFLALLIASSTLDYACARAIGAAADERRRRLFLGLSLGLNLLVLGVFKYFDFFAQSFGALLDGLGLHVSPPVLGIVLPVGVSFYTFQIMSYVIDVYRRRVPAEKDYVAYALFVAFFPHLVAGPIQRAEMLLPQVKAPRRVTAQQLGDGFWLILLGYFKKTVVADNLAPYVLKLKDGMPALSGGEFLVLFYAMVFYVYADFSGYSDIARGLAKLLGFELTANFRMPFFARNPPDFWRRWNVSLSDWFRDYVFAPLSRLRGKSGRTRLYMGFCAFLTLCLCGLWHGASWNYVAFGAAHGLLIIGYYALRPWLKAALKGPFWRSWTGRGVLNLAAFHLLSLPVIFFFVRTPGDAWGFVRSIVTAAYNRDALVLLATLGVFGVPLLVLDAFQERTGDLLVVRRLPPAARTLCYALTFAAIVLSGETGTHAFVYFQF